MEIEPPFSVVQPKPQFSVVQPKPQLPISLSSLAQCSTVTQGLVSPTSSLDAAEKQNVFLPAKNQISVIQSLYWLGYPDSEEEKAYNVTYRHNI